MTTVPVIITAIHVGLLSIEGDKAVHGKRRLRRGTCRAHPADLQHLRRFITEQAQADPPVVGSAVILNLDSDPQPDDRLRCTYLRVEWHCQADPTVSLGSPVVTLIATS
jgi:hypothetical protein